MNPIPSHLEVTEGNACGARYRQPRACPERPKESLPPPEGVTRGNTVSVPEALRYPREDTVLRGASSPSLLALFARGREIGYVVIFDGEIYQYGVKTIRVKRRDPGFVEQVTQTLLRLFERMEPECVVVIERSKTHPGQGQLTQVFAHIVDAFIRGIYSLMEISLDDAKMALCHSKRVTHQRLVEQVVAIYPTFWSKVFDARPEKARYWKKTLIALALALAAKEQMKTENISS